MVQCVYKNVSVHDFRVGGFNCQMGEGKYARVCLVNDCGFRLEAGLKRKGKKKTAYSIKLN